MDIEAELLALAKLAVAMLLCGALGWERESLGKAAGLRTHILVGVGSALIVLLAEFLVEHFDSAGEQMQFDPIRSLEAVAAAVSFLGAGTIIFAQGMERVRGLTTAASLWTTAAVGMAVALDLYVLAVGATLLLLLVMRVLLKVEVPIDKVTRDEPRWPFA
ncbi:MAG: MgtC/SapB family protein [Opitutaceae bacterium]|nr:MgtC/SapB family protein [Opitutaceae bacterium]